jgi:hypothetical protein
LFLEKKRMPPFTRSQRSTLLSGVDKYHLTTTNTKLGRVKAIHIMKPNMYEKQSFMRISRQTCTTNLIRAMVAAFEKQTPLKVVVHDSVTNTTFNKGFFHVTEMTSKHFHLFDQMAVKSRKEKVPLRNFTCTPELTLPPATNATTTASTHNTTAATTAINNNTTAINNTTTAINNTTTATTATHNTTAATTATHNTTAATTATHNTTAATTATHNTTAATATAATRNNTAATRNTTAATSTATHNTTAATATAATNITTAATHNTTAATNITTAATHNTTAATNNTTAATMNATTTSSTNPAPHVQVSDNNTAAGAAIFAFTKVFPSTAVRPVTAGPSFPHAIKTNYKGITFRSRLESRFAALMDELRVRYIYEPMKYNLIDGGTYMIDFFLPDQQLYVELKPKWPHIEEESKCEQMSARGFRVALLYGSSLHKPPFRSEFYRGKSHRDYSHHDALRGMTWINGRKLPGETVFVYGNHASFTTPLDVQTPDRVHLNHLESTTDMRWSHPFILQALHKISSISYY